jgi:hypothetical protein
LVSGAESATELSVAALSGPWAPFVLSLEHKYIPTLGIANPYCENGGDYTAGQWFGALETTIATAGAGLAASGGADSQAALLASRAQLGDALNELLATRAGFAGTGEPLIVDNSVPLNPQGLAAALRAAGYNAQSVGEIFGPDPGDSAILQLAEQLNGRVIASDVGHDIEGGFGQRVIQVPGQIRQLESIIRLLEAS